MLSCVCGVLFEEFMKKALQKLAGYLNILGFDYQKFLDDKKERIRAQKYCYIMKKKWNIDLNGTFSLYINGPYNSRLTDDLYEIANDKNAPNIANEGSISTGQLKQLRNLFTQNEQIDEVDLLEFYTTYSYLKENFPHLNEEEVDKELHYRKSAINKEYETNSIDVMPVIRNIYSNLAS